MNTDETRIGKEPTKSESKIRVSSVSFRGSISWACRFLLPIPQFRQLILRPKPADIRVLAELRLHELQMRQPLLEQRHRIGPKGARRDLLFPHRVFLDRLLDFCKAQP